MGRQAVDFDVRNAAPDRETIRCTGDCLIVKAASDANAIRCTGGCLDVRLRCTWPHRDQMTGN